MEDQSNMADRGSVLSCVLASQFISSERHFVLKATPPLKPLTLTGIWRVVKEMPEFYTVRKYPLFPFKP